MAPLILAHDLGTTGNKASLFGCEGALLASAYAAYDTHYPQPGWAEQDPDDWWRAVCATTQQLLSASAGRGEDIAVVSFSGQMMACLPVDAAGRPLRSAIIWADMRAERQAALLAERVGFGRVYTITGHRPSASYTLPKLMWVRDHQPEVFAHTRCTLQPKDYVAFRLTGIHATDYSDASGTNAFDLRARRWSDEMLSGAGIDPSLMPPVLPSTAILGRVTPEAARATGLRVDTPVVIGGGDGACATAGAGVVQPGDAYNYVGSSSWIAFVSREPLYDPQQRTFTFAHLDADYLFPAGTMQCAGGSFDWLERLLRGPADGRIHHELDELAASVEPGAKGLLFLPYLMGERSPHWNPAARGAFVGLSMAYGRAEMARAVLEGVALNLRIILDAFRDQGAAITALRVIGGGARSALWCQILADVYGLPLLRPKLLVEATALGAAIAGGVGAGLYRSFAEGCANIQVEPGEEPRPAFAARYRELYGLFQETYARLAPIFGHLATIP